MNENSSMDKAKGIKVIITKYSIPRPQLHPQVLIATAAGMAAKKKKRRMNEMINK